MAYDTGPNGSMNKRFRIDTTRIVSEIIDGEAIIMHQVSGDYFSADGLGCEIWRWIGEGRSWQQMVDMLAGRYRQTPPEMSRALDSFIADLLAHALILEAEDAGEADPAVAPEPPSNAVLEFAAPVLHVYTDMRDLLLLDPIHEVEAKDGWPVPKGAGDKP
jgi:hypothetical protein